MGRYTKIIVVLLIPFLLLNWQHVNAQEEEEPILLFSGKISNSANGKLAGVTVKFTQDGSLFQTVTTASSGKYPRVEAPYGHIYKVTFSKDGYVSKSVVIDAKKGFFVEDVGEKETNFDGMGTTLIKKQPNVDYSVITNRPVAKAHIDPSTGKLDFDFGYINTRSKEIQKFMEDLASKDNENEQKFIQLIKDGDKAVTSQQYENAIAKYEEALKIKADEDVESKIADAENKLEELEDQKKLDEEFNKTIKKGDDLLASNDFDGSIAEYNKAKGIKPGEKLPDEKIKAANEKRKLADSAALDKQYSDKMMAANKKFNSDELVEAEVIYKEALALKPTERDPKDKIAEIEAILKKRKELEERYSSLITAGDQAMSGENYDEAIAKFEEAISLKKEEAYPKEQLQKAKNLKAKADEEAGKQKKYDDLVAKANGEFSSEKWETAKATYSEALGMLPNEQLPKDKIAEIDAKLKELADADAAKAAKQKQYDDLISKANGQFNGEKLEEAKSTYNEALGVFPDEQLPKDKIAEIDAKLKELADAEAAKEAKQQQYDGLIAKANDAFGSEEWESAKSTYKEALGVFPNEQLPKDKIIEIDGKLKELEDLAAKQKQYDDLIVKANGEFGDEKWESSKATYNEALGVFPNEQLPKDKIAEIDAKLKELADADAENAAKAAKQKQYDDLITKANGEYGKDELEQAISTYKQALGVFPDEQLPKDKIAEIEAKIKALADAEEAKNLAEAEEKARKEKFDNLMANGNTQLQAGELDKAKASFDEASKIFPNDSAPKDKIAEINEKIKVQGEQNELDGKYNDIIAQADAARDAESWEPAKQLYKDANAVKPSETYPQEQITWINDKMKSQLKDDMQKQYQKIVDVADKMFADKEYAKATDLYNRANEFASADGYPSEKIAEIEKILADEAANEEKEKEYSYLIAQADNQFESEKWEEARTVYNKALALIDKQYPKDQISKIDGIINEGKDKEEAYNQLILKADGEFASEDWQNAKGNYEKALALMPNDYPKNQIEIIEGKLKALSEKSALDKKYNDKIAEADAARDAESWDPAKQLYKDANSIKPSESYPQEQIDWINEKMKSALEDEVNRQYQKIIDKADELLAAKEYEKSKGLYQRAKDMRPADSYPPKKISEINALLEQLEKENENASAQKIIDDKYNAIIAKADAARDAESWDPAKQLYKDANGVKPTESYPQEQIDWINERMKLALEDEVNKQYQKIIDKADELLAAKEYEKSKGLYQRAKDMRPADTYPPKKIAEIIALLDKLAKDNANASAQKIIDDKYNAIIAQADAARDAESWEPAKKLYKDANAVKPTESYPQEQINWINEKMRTSLDEEVNKQYQKIIDVADKLFGEEDYLKSKKLYQRAMGMKPGDSYPPSQIAKINAALAAKADKDKTNNLYSSYIKAGNSEFEIEKYRRALKSFQNALNVKPNAPYPQKKIDEINGILDQLAADKAERDRLKPAEFIENPYGEEVTGKYNEEDVKFIMSSGRINDNNINDEIIRKRKEDEALKLQTNTDDQHELGDRINDSYEEMETRISEFSKDADIQRENNADNMEAYKDNHDEVKGDRINLGRNVTYDNSEANEAMETRISEFSIDSDIQRQDNVKSMEEYKQGDYSDHGDRIGFGTDRTYNNEVANEKMETRISEFSNDSDIQRQDNVKSMEEYKHGDYSDHGDRIGFGTDRTYDNEVANERMETRISEFSVDSDIQRQDNVKSMEDYKQGDYSDHGDRIGFGTDRTYDNEVANEAMETRISEFSVDSDVQRQDNVKSMEDYKQGDYSDHGDRIGFGTDRTYDNEVANEKMETRISEFSNDSDIQRQDNVKSMEDYKQGDYSDHGDRIGFGTDRTYNNEVANEKMETRISEFSIDSDEQRQDNVKSLEHYQEKEWAIQSIRGETSSDKNYNTFEEQEDLLTERSKDMVDADNPRERNAEAVGKYEDDLKDMSTDYYNKDNDAGLENAEEMDRVKNQSNTMFVDENQQKLATQYPEGITEKMFERRNGRGDVIEVTILRIVVTGIKGDEYKKVTTKWGTAYFKNNGVISEYIWDTETN